MKHIHRLAWVLVFAVASALSTLIPPMQSPDEMSHLGRAYLISQGKWFLETLPPDLELSIQDQNVNEMLARARSLKVYLGGQVDQGLLEFADAQKASTVHQRSAADIQHISTIEWAGKERYFSLWGTVYYFPVVYLPQAAGLFIGQQLHWTVQNSYQLVRSITLLVCVVLFSIAFQLVPVPPVAVALLMLPMSVFQILSPTIDGLTTALAALVLSLFIYSLKNPTKSAPIWHMALCIFILATSRTHLTPMFLLPAYIAWRRNSWPGAWIVAGFFAGAIAWAGLALGANNGLMLDTQHTSAGLLLAYLANPLAFVKIVFSTLSDPVQSAFLQHSFIGILGWLDAPLDAHFYPVLWAGLGICAMSSCTFAGLGEYWGARAALAICAVAAIGLTFLALLVTFTPHPATLVQGVQGRYFLVPSIMLAYAISDYHGRRTLRTVLPALVVSALSIGALVITLGTRYSAAA